MLMVMTRPAKTMELVPGAQMDHRTSRFGSEEGFVFVNVWFRPRSSRRNMSSSSIIATCKRGNGGQWSSSRRSRRSRKQKPEQMTSAQL